MTQGKEGNKDVFVGLAPELRSRMTEAARVLLMSGESQAVFEDQGFVIFREGHIPEGENMMPLETVSIADPELGQDIKFHFYHKLDS